MYVNTIMNNYIFAKQRNSLSAQYQDMSMSGPVNGDRHWVTIRSIQLVSLGSLVSYAVSRHGPQVIRKARKGCYFKANPKNAHSKPMRIFVNFRKTPRRCNFLRHGYGHRRGWRAAGCSTDSKQCGYVQRETCTDLRSDMVDDSGRRVELQCVSLASV